MYVYPGKIFIELKKCLQRLPGVINVQITTDNQDNELLNVHMLAYQIDDPQHLLAQVIQCGKERNINITEEQISFAFLEPQFLEQKNEVRVVINGVATSREKTMIEVEVRLSYRNEKYIGRSTGIDRNPVKRYIAGGATIKALQEILPSDLELALIGIRKITIVEQIEALVALVMVIDAGKEYKFTGIALLNSNDDEIQAVVKAVLAALNRFLTGSVLE